MRQSSYVYMPLITDYMVNKDIHYFS